MREVEEYMKEFENRVDLLLEEKFDEAFVGVDLETCKPIYDVDKIEEIYKKEGNGIFEMDKELFSIEGEKPIYMNKYENGLVKVSKALPEDLYLNKERILTAAKKYIDAESENA